MKRINNRTVELTDAEMTAKKVYDAAEEVAGERRAREIVEGVFPRREREEEFGVEFWRWLLEDDAA